MAKRKKQFDIDNLSESYPFKQRSSRMQPARELSFRPRGLQVSKLLIPLMIVVCYAFVFGAPGEASDSSMSDQSALGMLSEGDFHHRVSDSIYRHDLRGARSICRKGIKAHPDSKMLNEYMLMLDEGAGDLRASIPEAERCLNLSPESTGGYKSLWHLFMVQGDYCKAEQYLKKAMAISSAGNNDALIKSYIAYEFDLELALTLERQGRPAEALALMQKASQGRDADQRVFLAIGDLLLRVGKTDQAEISFKRANSEQPDSTSWLYLGAAQSLLGQPVLAQQSFHEAIETDSDSRWGILEEPQRKKARQALRLVGTGSANLSPNRLFSLLGKSMCFLEDALVPWPNKISCSGWYHHYERREIDEESPPE